MTFPPLARADLSATRHALHGYAQVLGNWLKQCRTKRKHWWHASLRPSLNGLTTGVVHGPVTFELELNLTDNLLAGRTIMGARFTEALHGQSSLEIAALIEHFLTDAGIGDVQLPTPTDDPTADYAPDQARLIGGALRAVAGALGEFRASIVEETSPIQIWPHHFDLSMLWLPGEKIAGQDPSDEEYSDKQMNFGFTLGDEQIPDPYLYVTAYPTPEAMATIELPGGATWRTSGFNGAVVLYETLANQADPLAYLLTLWGTLLAAGRKHMLEI